MTDLALVNANVLTMDPARPRATAVAVAHGRITALDEIPPGAAQVVDLHGATVLPGFHDAHNHMIGFGMSLGEVDIGSPAVGSLDELYAADRPAGADDGAGGVGDRVRLRPEQGRRTTRTGTPWTGPRPGAGSGCGTPPGTCAW